MNPNVFFWFGINFHIEIDSSVNCMRADSKRIRLTHERIHMRPAESQWASQWTKSLMRITVFRHRRQLDAVHTRKKAPAKNDWVFEAEHTGEQSAIERQRTIKDGNEYSGERIQVIQTFERSKKYAAPALGTQRIDEGITCKIPLIMSGTHFTTFLIFSERTYSLSLSSWHSYCCWTL